MYTGLLFYKDEVVGWVPGHPGQHYFVVLFLLAWFGILRLFVRLLGTVETVGTFWKISARLVRDIATWDKEFAMPRRFFARAGTGLPLPDDKILH